jgi:uncharacterized protein
MGRAGKTDALRFDTPKPTRVDVIVKPGSKRPGIAFESETLVLRVRERAIEGAANAACIRALAEFYDIAPSSITLLRGAKSKKKTFALLHRPK